MHDFIKLLKTIKNFTSEGKELPNCDFYNQPTIRGKTVGSLAHVLRQNKSEMV